MCLGYTFKMITCYITFFVVLIATPTNCDTVLKTATTYALTQAAVKCLTCVEGYKFASDACAGNRFTMFFLLISVQNTDLSFI